MASGRSRCASSRSRGAHRPPPEGRGGSTDPHRHEEGSHASADPPVVHRRHCAGRGARHHGRERLCPGDHEDPLRAGRRRRDRRPAAPDRGGAGQGPRGRGRDHPVQERGDRHPGRDQRAGRRRPGDAVRGAPEGRRCRSASSTSSAPSSSSRSSAKEHYKTWKDLDGQEIAVQAAAPGPRRSWCSPPSSTASSTRASATCRARRFARLALLKGTIKATILDAPNKNLRHEGGAGQVPRPAARRAQGERRGALRHHRLPREEPGRRRGARRGAAQGRRVRSTRTRASPSRSASGSGS